MALQDQLIAISNRGFLKRISDDLFQGIKKVYNTDPNERRRWIWELIQNAKDTPNDFGSVSIEIRLTKNSLIFSHNGNPFSIENLVGIIQQVSTKSSGSTDEETTGKFGTGFITTHMLSRIIHVSGNVVYDNLFKKFDFELNRDAETQELLLDKVEEQIKQLYRLPDDNLFKPNPINLLKRDENVFNTSFTYPLSENSVKYAQQGVEDLKQTAHYALLFNKRIKQFEVYNEITNEHYKISRVESKNVSEQIEEVITKIEFNESTAKFHLLCFRKEKEFDIAIPVFITESGYEVLIPDKSTPRIFKDFPLIGTENWGSNFILNSKKFQPTEPRDGLELHIEEDAPKKEQELNRNTLKSIYGAFADLINQLAASSLKINNLHLLCESALLKNKLNEHDDVLKWLKEEIQVPFRSSLITLPLVLTVDGLKPIVECKFPIFSKIDNKHNEFYTICKSVIKGLIPVESCYEDWLSIIKGDRESWGEGLLFELEDMVSFIKTKAELNSFTEFEMEDKLIQWLNGFYEFLISNNKIELFKHEIIPNQERKFVKASDLSIDTGIPNEIKDIAKNFAVEYRTRLADKRVKCTEIQKQISVDDVSKELNAKIGALTQAINPKTGQHTITDAIKTSLLHLCCIFYDSNSNDKRRKILSRLQKFYPTIDLTFPIVPESKDFEFASSVKCLTKFALLQLSQVASIPKLQNYLQQENESDTILWLNLLLSEIHENGELNDFLNYFGVFPNQEKSFALKSQLSQDVDQVEEMLKTVYSKLYPKDPIKKRLLLDGIGVYPDSKVTFEEIARKIDNGLKEKQNDTSNPDNKAIILQMVSWCKVNKAKAEQFFTWLENNKALLVLQTIEGDNAQQDIFRILQSNQDYKKLADIAESGADLDKINQIAIIVNEHNIDLSKLEHIAQMAGTIGVDIIESMAAEKYEEELDRKFKTVVGGNIEDAFRETFEAMKLNISIVRDPLGQDFTLILPKGTNHKVEIKSVAHGSGKALLSKLQGQTAVTMPDNYTLCVMERPIGALYPDKAQFANLARFVMNIGHLIKEKVESGSIIEQTISNSIAQEIGLEFESVNYKFGIKKNVWESNLTLEQFAKKLIPHLNCT
jgi:hypothetical protein